ncbi:MULTISPECIES: hypothetical protein [unclassified Streptomyces]|uniref:hypothetical protein n=1 Tax=unclassified Streptomyces TaxID=2593676 RepID=UPI003D93FB25
MLEPDVCDALRETCATTTPSQGDVAKTTLVKVVPDHPEETVQGFGNALFRRMIRKSGFTRTLLVELATAVDRREQEHAPGRPPHPSGSRPERSPRREPYARCEQVHGLFSGRIRLTAFSVQIHLFPENVGNAPRMSKATAFPTELPRDKVNAGKVEQ